MTGCFFPTFVLEQKKPFAHFSARSDGGEDGEQNLEGGTLSVERSTRKMAREKMAVFKGRTENAESTN
jgi:hypothetical protein